MQDTDPVHPASQAARLAAWIRLEQTPGVGPVSVQRLLDRFDNPTAIFNAGYDALAGVVPGSLARVLCAPPAPGLAAAVDATLDAALAWLAIDSHHLLTLDHPAYPPLLRTIADPPVLLYAIGNVALLCAPSIAIVGSRNASVQGVANARAFAQELSGAGLGIVSGMALGIDAAAHEGGLCGPGSTIAVVGTGADRVYPRRNRELAHRIAQQGCVVSEYPLGIGPLAGNFPRRNRIISGLSCAVLVVEAAAGSGSLITANTANDQGRDIFAIPGSIHAPLSKGCHKLIKAGAKLVETAADVLDELHMAPLAGLGAARQPACALEHHELLTLLGYGPVGTDTIATLTDTAPGLLAGQLLALELAGHVERLPGGLFQRVIR